MSDQNSPHQAARQPPHRDGDLHYEGINWVTSTFLISTFVVALITTPLYIWKLGFGPLELSLFVAMYVVSGLSITAGYHRLFTHVSYRASWPVRLFLLLFGASTFESSALLWCSDHRYHHKYSDMDGDPHDPHNIRRGFFWAHMGWMLVYVSPFLERDNVEDLKRDRLVAWQHKYFVPVAIGMGFVFPMAIGATVTSLQGRGVLAGLAAGFVWGGCTRIVAVMHSTFLINSAAHTFGRQPYDSETTARDSHLLALITFGEGYHNYHHVFETDYRLGTLAWHWDPGKWLIWTFGRLGLANNLRRVPKETIALAKIREARRRVDRKIEGFHPDRREQIAATLTALEERLQELHLQVRTLLSEKSRLARERGSARLSEIEQQLAQFKSDFRAHVKEWKRQRRLLLSAAPV